MLVGTRVKELCKERGISVAQLEKMADIPPKSISKWDKSMPSFDKVQRVLDALEISYEEFANIGMEKTQKIQTALVKIRLADPDVYNDIMSKYLAEEDKKILDTENVEQIYSASEPQKELIQEVLRLSEKQVLAFLSLAKSLPNSQEVPGDLK